MKPKKRVNSRAKGARIEREAAKFLTSIGFPTTRAARCGVDNGEDLCHAPGVLANVHLEVKGDERLWPWTKQMNLAFHQATKGKFEKSKKRCAVLWKHNGKPWALTFAATTVPMLWVTVYDLWIAKALAYLNGDADAPRGEKP